MRKAPLVRDHEKFVLRLPEGMRDRIASAAKENGRSMNAEIVTRIEISFRQQEILSEVVAGPDSMGHTLRQVMLLPDEKLNILADLIAEGLTRRTNR